MTAAEIAYKRNEGKNQPKNDMNAPENQLTLINRQCEMSKKKKKMLKVELKGLIEYFDRFQDTQIVERMKQTIEQIDFNIKSETLAINTMTSRHKTFMRLDIVQKEVNVEKVLVIMEEKLSHVKGQINLIMWQKQEYLKQKEGYLDRYEDKVKEYKFMK